MSTRDDFILPKVTQDIIAGADPDQSVRYWADYFDRAQAAPGIAATAIIKFNTPVSVSSSDIGGG